jgi:hypothetical protein
MATKEKMIAPGAPKRRPPSTEPRRLTPVTEEHIREMCEQPGFKAPTILILLHEIDALRLELAAAKGARGE